MADHFSKENFQKDMESILRDTLPDAATLWRMDPAVRSSWEVKPTPYFVHEMSAYDDAEEWGAIGGNFTWEWTGHFIETLPTSIEYVDEVLEAVRVGIRQANMGIDGFPLSGVTLIWGPVLDTSREAEVNEIFYGSNKPNVGGAIKARFVGGNLDE